jgi:hypothetical protein
MHRIYSHTRTIIPGSNRALLAVLLLLFLLSGLFTPAAPPPAAAQTEDMSIEFVGSIGGGNIWSVAGDGSYAYVGQGNALTVLDVSDPAQPQWVARLPLSRAVSSNGTES